MAFYVLYIHDFSYFGSTPGSLESALRMATKSGFAITKLGESNYKTWKTNMIDVLLSEGLWCIVCGEDVGPGEAGSTETMAGWEMRRARAAVNIRLAMDERIRSRYTDEKYRADPVALWNKIEEDRKAVVALDQNFLLTQLYHTKLEIYGTVTRYVDAINAITDNLRTCGKAVGEDDQWFYIVHGLPESWSVFRHAMEGTNGKRDVQKLISEMLAEEARLKRDKGLGAGSAPYAKKARGKKGMPAPQGGGDDQRKSIVHWKRLVFW